LRMATPKKAGIRSENPSESDLIRLNPTESDQKKGDIIDRMNRMDPI
jgi:hypothetical protein